MSTIVEPMPLRMRRLYDHAVATRWVARLAGWGFACNLAVTGVAVLVLLPGFRFVGVIALVAAAGCALAVLRYTRTRMKFPFRHLTSDFIRGGDDEVAWRPALLVVLPVACSLLSAFTGKPPTPEQAQRLFSFTILFELFLLPAWLPWLVGSLRRRPILERHAQRNPAEVHALRTSIEAGGSVGDVIHRLINWTPELAGRSDLTGR